MMSNPSAQTQESSIKKLKTSKTYSHAKPTSQTSYSTSKKKQTKKTSKNSNISSTRPHNSSTPNNSTTASTSAEQIKLNTAPEEYPPPIRPITAEIKDRLTPHIKELKKLTLTPAPNSSCVEWKEDFWITEKILASILIEGRT